jgi:hypothetical protein
MNTPFICTGMVVNTFYNILNQDLEEWIQRLSDGVSPLASSAFVDRYQIL